MARERTTADGGSGSRGGASSEQMPRHAAPLLSPEPQCLPDWVISDTHWFHANIARYAQRPADHEIRMMTAWRTLVRPDEVILHLGDVALGSLERLEADFPELPGRILFLRGNHDSARRIALYQTHGWRLVAPFSLTYHGWQIAFRHAPTMPLPEGIIQIHGHIHQHREPTERHINVSVERCDFHPVRLQALLDARIRQLEQDRDRSDAQGSK